MLRVIRTLLATAAVFIAAVVVRADITAKDALRTMPDSILEPFVLKVQELNPAWFAMHLSP